MTKPIVITAGHSNTDPGATAGVLTEAHIVTDFRNLVAYYLRRSGANFATDGDGHENWPLRDAAMLARNSIVAVEFHCNSFTNPNATGVETLSSASDKDVGRRLCEAVAGVLYITNRGAKAEGSGQHSRLAFVQAGGIILELFFLSNPSDLKAYLDKKWLVARAVADVLLEVANERSMVEA